MGADVACLPCARRDCGRCSDDRCLCYQDDPTRHHSMAAALARQEAREKEQVEKQRARREDDLRLARMSTGSQLGLLPGGHTADTATARLEQTEAIWLDRALPVLQDVARSQPYLTTVDIWKELSARRIPEPHDTRAMGTLMRQGRSHKAIRLHDRDARPRVWRSLIYPGGSTT